MLGFQKYFYLISILFFLSCSSKKTTHTIPKRNNIEQKAINKNNKKNKKSDIIFYKKDEKVFLDQVYSKFKFNGMECTKIYNSKPLAVMCKKSNELFPIVIQYDKKVPSINLFAFIGKLKGLTQDKLKEKIFNINIKNNMKVYIESDNSVVFRDTIRIEKAGISLKELKGYIQRWISLVYFILEKNKLIDSIENQYIKNALINHSKAVLNNKSIWSPYGSQKEVLSFLEKEIEKEGYVCRENKKNHLIYCNINSLSIWFIYKPHLRLYIYSFIVLLKGGNEKDIKEILNNILYQCGMDLGFEWYKDNNILIVKSWNLFSYKNFNAKELISYLKSWEKYTIWCLKKKGLFPYINFGK